MERVVANRYRLVRELGRGGMGVVWLATDEFLGRQVAVKELRPPQGLTGEDFDILQRRAIQEARSAARIHHPNAVTLYEAIPPTPQDHALYLIMEFIDGPTLGQLVTREGALPGARVAAFGLQLLDVLDAAHALGIVHRDVKPGNILIAAGDRVKLTDFGIAYSMGDPRLTRTGVMGTQAYQAPELFDSVPITPAVDLWSLGATLYYAADGRGPFDRDSTGATLRAIVLDELPAPRCDQRLATAITGLLRRDPDKRATPDQTAALLRQVPNLQAKPAADGARPVLDQPTAPDQVSQGGWDPHAETGLRKDVSPPVVPPQKPRFRRRLWAMIAAGVLVVAGAAVGGTLAAQSGAQSGGASLNLTATSLAEQANGQTVAFENTSRQLLEVSYSDGWQGPDVLPGRLVADSPIVISPTGPVFFVQSDGSVVTDYYVAGHGWEGPGTTGGTAGRDSSLGYFQGGGDIDPYVVFVDPKGQLVYDDHTSAWTGPHVLPGIPRDGSPLAVSSDGTRIFFILSDGAVVDDFHSASGWGGPYTIGGGAGADSGLAYSPGDSSFQTQPAVVFRGTGGALEYDYYAAPNWSGPHTLPGVPLPGTPIDWRDDGTSVYFIDENGLVSDDYFHGSSYASSSSWKGPYTTGGSAAVGSGLTFAPSSGTDLTRANVVFVGSAGELATDWLTNGTWHGPQPLIKGSG